MAFNAGGTNVGGVQSIEQGSLKITQKNSDISGVGTYYADFEVPAGKKWIIKAVNSSVGNFVGTKSYQSFGVYIGSLSAGLVSSTGADISFTLPINLCLEAGQSIRNMVITSAYTSGQLTLRILYQEVDV